MIFELVSTASDYLAPTFLCAICVAIPATVVLTFRKSFEVTQLRKCFPAINNTPDLTWWRFISATFQCSPANRGGSLKMELHVAFSPEGLYLKTGGLTRLIVGLPPIFIPWEFVRCENRSKFGYFQATFTICGFTDGHTVELNIGSTDLRRRTFFEQCAVAARVT